MTEGLSEPADGADGGRLLVRLSNPGEKEGADKSLGCTSAVAVVYIAFGELHNSPDALAMPD